MFATFEILATFKISNGHFCQIAENIDNIEKISNFDVIFGTTTELLHEKKILFQSFWNFRLLTTRDILTFSRVAISSCESIFEAPKNKVSES